MDISSIALTVHRLRGIPALEELPICPVAPAPAPAECVVVNRLFETRDDNVRSLIAVTVLSAAFDRMEVIGDLIVEGLKDGDEPWSLGEAKDVLFEKLGADVTGFDAGRQQYVRTIEFGVSW